MTVVATDAEQAREGLDILQSSLQIMHTRSASNVRDASDLFDLYGAVTCGITFLRIDEQSVCLSRLPHSHTQTHTHTHTHSHAHTHTHTHTHNRAFSETRTSRLKGTSDHYLSTLVLHIHHHVSYA